LVLVAALMAASVAVHRAEAASINYQQTMQELAEAIQAAQALNQESQRYDVVFRRDPMQPLINSQGEIVFSSGWHGGLSAQGIIWSEARPLVIADDELLAVGDTIGPYKITDIQPNGLTVERDGETLFVPLDRGMELPVAEPVAVAPQ
jgi:hypothetical protein